MLFPSMSQFFPAIPLIESPDTVMSLALFIPTPFIVPSVTEYFPSEYLIVPCTLLPPISASLFRVPSNDAIDPPLTATWLPGAKSYCLPPMETGPFIWLFSWPWEKMACTAASTISIANIAGFHERLLDWLIFCTENEAVGLIHKFLL